MANGGLITDYLVKGAGPPSAFSFPGGSVGVPSLGNNSTETLRYLNTTNNHEYAWDGSAFQDVTGAGGGGGTGTTALLLDYEPNTDIQNGSAMTANTWMDVCANQSFTVGAGTSAIEVSVSGNVRATGTGTVLVSQIVVDSAGTPITKKVGAVGGPTDANALTGANLISLGSLTAGVHTIKVQARAGSAGTLYCRCASNIEEFLAVRVFERK